MEDSANTSTAQSVPTEAAAAWIFASLEGMEVAAWRDPIPEEDAEGDEIELPYVSVSVMPTPDVRFNGRARARSLVEATVKVVAGWDASEPVLEYVAEIDRRLDGKTNEHVHGEEGRVEALILQCLRTIPVDYPEVDGSGAAVYWHVGGVYQVMLR